MPADFHSLTGEQREQAQNLFFQALEAGDAACIDAAGEGAVAEAARSLYRMHLKASGDRFLDDPLPMAAIVAAEADRRAFEEGQVLASRFHVLRVLGVGGMGEVYLARDERLGEQVALKTIRPLLAEDADVRVRFLGEVRNARRVTHPNVCRIFDIFDEGATPFFSMEWIEGETLDRFLQRPSHIDTVRSIAIQLAEGLHAAHRNGIIHRDFKPQNVILANGAESPRAVITDFGLARAFAVGDARPAHSMAAGTLDFMAPELLAGEAATVGSDIFAFGKVLQRLMPGNRLAAACAAARLEDRPASLEGVIGALKREGGTRRWLLGAGAATAAAAAGAVLYRSFTGRPPEISGRQRVVLNGFRADASLAPRAGTLRHLFLAGIRQSPLVSVIPDERLRAVLRQLKLPTDLPAGRQSLLAAAAQENASLIVEGAVTAASGGLSLALRLFRGNTMAPAGELTRAVSDPRLVVSLAEQIVVDMRKMIGESAVSLRASHTPLDRVTSSSPEAVDFYFQGLREYERSDADAAIAFLDRALAIDPEFALAHLQRGLALGASFRTEAGFEAAERAFQLRGKLTERERNWIEWAYYHLGGDYLSALNSIRKNAVLFPDEAAFQRQTAGAYCRLNRFADAPAYNRRSVELDPFSANNWDEYICNLAEGDRPDEALDVYNKLRAQDAGTMVVEFGAGLACLVRGDYDRAIEHYRRLGGTAYMDRWARLVCASPEIMQGRFQSVAATLEADLAYDVATSAAEQLRRYQRDDLLGSLRLLMGEPAKALEHAGVLCALPASGVWLQQLRQGALMALDAGNADIAGKGLAKLRAVEQRWASTHSQGARLNVEGAIRALSNDPAAGDLLLKARGLWPDPLSLRSLALWQMAHGETEAALATLDELAGLRGKILKYYFPGILVMAWRDRARCLKKLARPDDALRAYRQVLDHWGARAANYPLLREIREEARSVRG